MYLHPDFVHALGMFGIIFFICFAFGTLHCIDTKGANFWHALKNTFGTAIVISVVSYGFSELPRMFGSPEYVAPFGGVFIVCAVFFAYVHLREGIDLEEILLFSAAPIIATGIIGVSIVVLDSLGQGIENQYMESHHSLEVEPTDPSWNEMLNPVSEESEETIVETNYGWDM
jgi:hypothetical protein